MLCFWVECMTELTVVQLSHNLLTTGLEAISDQTTLSRRGFRTQGFEGYAFVEYLIKKVINFDYILIFGFRTSKGKKINLISLSC